MQENDSKPATDVATGISDPTNTTTDPVTDPANAVTDAATTVTDAATTATDQSPSADDGKASTFSKCKVEMYKSLSTMGKGASILLKGFGQAALTMIGALFGAFNGLLSITATTGDTVAKGVNLVNNAAGSIVLVRDVTGGAATLATEFATMNHENSDFIIQNDEKLFKSLDDRLDNYNPASESSPIASTTGKGGADGKSTDTTADDIAPPTNEAT